VRLRLTLLTAAIALITACTEHPASSLVVAGPRDAISDGATDGNAHFFFLPPMVANPGHGTNDATLSPEVVICQWDGTACVATLATYTTDPGTTTTTQPGNSETVRASAAHYIVNWHTRDFGLDPALTYRICVKVGDVELGFADVDVAASGRELRDTGEGFVAVLNGRTLPIKFRIEQGALDEPSISGCGGQPT